MAVEVIDPSEVVHVVEGMGSWIDQSIHMLVQIVDQLGVAGIFVMTFLESTFVPIPSELTMLPAGYLVHEGQMDLVSVLIASILGTIGGSYFNYWIAKRYGRGLFLRYGKYFFMTPEKLLKLEIFFAKHGSISTFTGRLIPGVRHCISFPAGLANMDLKKFFIYTGLGGAIWMSTLIAVGYYIGKNQELAMKLMPTIKLAMIGVIAVLIVGYLVRNARRNKIAASKTEL